MAGLAAGAERRRGLVPAASEVYAFTVPPVVGGPIAVESLTVISFVLWSQINGQTHEQVKDLPPGAQIGEFTISD